MIVIDRLARLNIRHGSTDVRNRTKFYYILHIGIQRLIVHAPQAAGINADGHRIGRRVIPMEIPAPVRLEISLNRAKPAPGIEIHRRIADWLSIRINDLPADMVGLGKLNAQALLLLPHRELPHFRSKSPGLNRQNNLLSRIELIDEVPRAIRILRRNRI